MERLDQALPTVARRPPVAAPKAAQPRNEPEPDRVGATIADRMLVLSSLLLVVSAAGLASGSRFEMIFLAVFALGLVLTLLARRVLALDARAQKATRDPR